MKYYRVPKAFEGAFKIIYLQYVFFIKKKSAKKIKT